MGIYDDIIKDDTPSAPKCSRVVTKKKTVECKPDN